MKYEHVLYIVSLGQRDSLWWKHSHISTYLCVNVYAYLPPHIMRIKRRKTNWRSHSTNFMSNGKNGHHDSWRIQIQKKQSRTTLEVVPYLNKAKVSHILVGSLLSHSWCKKDFQNFIWSHSTPYVQQQCSPQLRYHHK